MLRRKSLFGWLRTPPKPPKLNMNSAVYALGAIVSLGVGFLLSYHFPHGLDHWSTDLKTAYLSERLTTQHPRIALIIVSDRTLEEYPYVSPVDRQLLAELVDRIDQSGAKTIGIDFIFDRPTEPTKDRTLIQSIQRAKVPIVLGALDVRTSLSDRDRAFQANFLAQTKRPVGHLHFDQNHDALVISDHVVRYIAKPSPDQPTQRSFAEILAVTAGHVDPPSSRYISWLLPPKNRSETFLTLSAEQVLGRSNPPIELRLADLFRNRIVLIGGNFADRDRHLTPLSVISEERFSGVFIHAQILAQLLDSRYTRSLSFPIELMVLVIAACIGIWLGRRNRSGHYHLWVESTGVVGLIAISAVAFVFISLVFPITPTLLFLLAGTAFGYHSKRLLK